VCWLENRLLVAVAVGTFDYSVSPGPYF